MQDIPQQGSIADIFIPRLVAHLHRDGFEGAIRVTLGPTTKILYFKRGEIASAASNAETDRLANILIEDGRLTAPQLELARSRMQAGGSLGKILIEMGFLTPAELLHGARRQVRQILASCCTLSSGSYQVDSGPLPAEVTVLGLPTRRVLFDAILQARDRRWIVRQMGSMESVYRPTAELTSGLDALRLEPPVDAIARMVDGTQTLRDLSGHTSMDDFTVSKVVLALEVLAFVELAGVPVPPAPRAGRTITIEDDPGDLPVMLPADEPAFVEVAAEPPPGMAPADAQAPFAVDLDQADSGQAAIPEAELPEFPEPSTSRPNWEIDARTGERVHIGPIELTFDGPTGPPRPRTGDLTRLLVIAVCATFLLAALFVMLVRRDRSDAPSRSVATVVPASGAAGRGVAHQGDAPPGTPPAASPAPAGPPAPETESGDSAPDRRVPEPPPAEQTAPQEITSLPAAAGPTPSAIPMRQPAAEPPPAAPPATGDVRPAVAAPFGDATGYASALSELDNGEAARAALTFQQLVAAGDPGQFTLQLMIACETETLDKLRRQSEGRRGFYVLPYAHKGRGCYRALWGTYPSLEGARQAIDALPASFSASGLRPIIVSMGRLRLPS